MRLFGRWVMLEWNVCPVVEVDLWVLSCIRVVVPCGTKYFDTYIYTRYFDVFTAIQCYRYAIDVTISDRHETLPMTLSGYWLKQYLDWGTIIIIIYVKDHCCYYTMRVYVNFFPYPTHNSAPARWYDWFYDCTAFVEAFLQRESESMFSLVINTFTIRYLSTTPFCVRLVSATAVCSSVKIILLNIE